MADSENRGEFYDLQTEGRYTVLHTASGFGADTETTNVDTTSEGADDHHGEGIEHVKGNINTEKPAEDNPSTESSSVEKSGSTGGVSTFALCRKPCAWRAEVRIRCLEAVKSYLATPRLGAGRKSEQARDAAKEQPSR